MKYEKLTQAIIGSFYEVYRKLGYGFLEKVYENSLYIEMTRRGISCNKQTPIKEYYRGISVGTYFADIVVENKIILELKASESICQEHEFQLINYLKATDIEVGLLLNFGKEPQIKRKIFDNSLKYRDRSGNP